jgi:biofilm protein TabA
MISDTLDRISDYRVINKNLEISINYIKSHNLSDLPIGKTVIESDLVFASVSEYETKDENNAKWESHKLYGDIQILLSGEEKIGYTPVREVSLIEAYNPDKDVMFYSGKGSCINMKPGFFAIFLPQDAHQPNVTLHHKCFVKKVVIKFKI